MHRSRKENISVLSEACCFSAATLPPLCTRWIIAIAVLAVLAADANASGWNDYELEIDQGYKIFRCNSWQVCLGTADGQVLYDPGSHKEGTGPIVEYCVTPTHVLLHTRGRSRRGPNEAFENADSSQEYFFILDKATNFLSDPFSANGFSASPLLAQIGPIRWVEPMNPHPEQAYAGRMMFIGMLLLVFVAPLDLATCVIVSRLHRMLGNSISV